MRVRLLYLLRQPRKVCEAFQMWGRREKWNVSATDVENVGIARIELWILYGTCVMDYGLYITPQLSVSDLPQNKSILELMCILF